MPYTHDPSAACHPRHLAPPNLGLSASLALFLIDQFPPRKTRHREPRQALRRRQPSAAGKQTWISPPSLSPAPACSSSSCRLYRSSAQTLGRRAALLLLLLLLRRREGQWQDPTEDVYSGVEVRVTPMRTEIIIHATRTHNVLGEKGRKIRELTSVVQKRFNFPENGVELYAKKGWRRRARRAEVTTAG
ncbi:hypothetical protein GUJ93_ZPchr0006g43727 [Zizania palustris]|uniref:KH type-2 domain-containing protein n=1 Tax=Zizania palustris TaxID=103762 RepID=A0A8J5T2Q0_ZIZPA|nr:hypothetical protein GUJ93_ZPchr0006g43727 [Zizania palustris]